MYLCTRRFDGLLGSEAESRRNHHNHETPLPPELEMDPEWIWVSGTGCRIATEVSSVLRISGGFLSFLVDCTSIRLAFSRNTSLLNCDSVGFEFY